MLSVIVPTYNRRASVIRLLEALGRQRQITDALEILVMVDGSSDDTVDVVRSRTWPFDVRVIEQPRQGQAAARNRGAGAARGDVLVFLDDDMVPQPTFLHELLTTLDDGVDCVIPALEIGDWVPDHLLAREFGFWNREAARPMPHDPVRFEQVLFSANAIRRSWFEQMGGFDESFTAGGAYGNEDIELGHRLLKAGAVFRHQPRARAQTEPLLDAALVLRRERDVARNDVRLVAKHRELGSEVFGHRLRESRIHRLVAPALLAAPWLAILTAPVRHALLFGIRRGLVGRLPYRIWFALRAVDYWQGVAACGGRSLVKATTGTHA
ncbi:MAG TPA: glycosyltransferase [Gemmatimonadales bacterium]|nr:glycosyltransferase [Gemmatimonadales bacterium]